MSDLPRPIPPDLLARPVSGRNLRLGPLGRQLGPGATLLAFLRHFG